MAKKGKEHIIEVNRFAGGTRLNVVEIHGGKMLEGCVEIQGSKNAVLPILAGSLLCNGISVIRNCPEISDAADMLRIMKALGCRISGDGSLLIIDASDLTGSEIDEALALKMRSSILFLGALLGRTGRAVLPYPGGCVLGKRPIDLHVSALEAMGAVIREENGRLYADAERISGAEITLRFPSVGATENIILAAVTGVGKTIIRNAALEPEVKELCNFLKQKGADIYDAGNGVLQIQGIPALRETEYRLVPDRIAAGTYALAAGITRGRIELQNPPIDQMHAFWNVVRRMGMKFRATDHGLWCDGTDCRQGGVHIQTAPYPGFPTDLQSPIMALLSVCSGKSDLNETIFESRFKIVPELKKMGAEIFLYDQCAQIRGIPVLHGAEVAAKELRGAAALVLAGLNAEGVTRVSGTGYLERGYERLPEKLAELGADIRFV